jgi:hypothetical protein
MGALIQSISKQLICFVSLCLRKPPIPVFLIYMKFTLQFRVWLGLSTLFAGVYLTDKSWRELDASLTGLKGTIFIINGAVRVR